MNLCDLAAAEGLYTKEDPNLNRSIGSLRSVLTALGEEEGSEIPYSGSKLTRLLQNSIGNQSQTLLIATVSSNAEQAEQILTTMKFADKTREVII